MDEHDFLAEQFEEHRAHLRAVAYRMLGSLSEADDAVQEAWLRLSRSDTERRREPGRLADHGRRAGVPGHAALARDAARGAARVHVPDPIVSREDGVDPEHEALLADSVGLALLVVLETLTPAERLAFVLHDMFAVPFDEIAPIVDRSPAAARQLASRARRRVQGAERRCPTPTSPRQREVVDAFFAASRDGDFEALVAVLDPDVVSAADGGAWRPEATAIVRGAREVAARAITFARLAPFVRPALVNGAAGVVVAPPGETVRGHGLHRGRAGGSSRSTRSRIPRACASSTWPCSTTDGSGGGGRAASTARSTHAGSSASSARVDVVARRRARGRSRRRRRPSSASRAALGELDADHRVAAAVGDPHRQARAVEVGAPALDGRDEAAHRDDPRRRRAPGAEAERVGHDRALREAAEDRALPRHAGELGDVALQELVGGVEGVGVGEADARHDVPVAPAGRQEAAARRA